MPKIIILMMVGILLMSCSTARERVRPNGAVDNLGAEERFLLESGEPSAPLPVVRNTDAGNIEFLRRKAMPVSASDLSIPVLLSRMLATVELEQGVGIAAPQVGISRRAIWVRRLDKGPEMPFEACLNPEIIGVSGDFETDWEGCLSVVGGFGKVPSHSVITIRYQGSDGVLREETVSGFTARIFQHEIDHLDGVLFIDRIDKDTGLMLEEEYRAMRKREKEQKEQENNPPSGS